MNTLDALLKAVVQILQAGESWSDRVCGITPGDGRPPPVSGELFIGVEGSSYGRSDPDLNTGIDEICSVSVTIHRRCAFSPYDRLADEVIHKETTGMSAIAYRIMARLHLSYAVTAAANALLPSNPQGFIEPLRWVSTDSQPRLVTGSHYQSADDGTYAALLMSIRFADARRKRTLENFLTELS